MVYVFLADGFEIIEALAPVDMLRRAKIDVKTVGVTGETVRSSCGVDVTTDITIDEFDFYDVQAIVLPGGMPGTLQLGDHERVNGIIREFAEQKKLVAAICAAPSVLGAAGILEGKTAVCHPGFEGELKGANVIYENVAVDENIITSRGMGTAFDFGLAIVSYFMDDEVVADVRTHMIY